MAVLFSLTLWFAVSSLSNVSSKEMSFMYVNCVLFAYRFMLLADYDAYIKCQDRVNEVFKVTHSLLILINAAVLKRLVAATN